MAAAKTNTVKAEAKEAVPANPTKVVWPVDRGGVFHKLKAALIAAAGRVNGDKDKMKLLLEILETGKGHAVSRYKDRKAAPNYPAKFAAEREAREKELMDKRQAKAIAEAEALLRSVKGE